MGAAAGSGSLHQLGARQKTEAIPALPSLLECKLSIAWTKVAGAFGGRAG